jgi:hypothetical protein
VQLSGLPLRGGGYALAVQVNLRQTLRSLVTSSNIVNAMTWDQEVVLVVQAAEMQGVIGEVRSLVDQFIRDWRAVH